MPASEIPMDLCPTKQIPFASDTSRPPCLCACEAGGLLLKNGHDNTFVQCNFSRVASRRLSWDGHHIQGQKPKATSQGRLDPPAFASSATSLDETRVRPRHPELPEHAPVPAVAGGMLKRIPPNLFNTAPPPFACSPREISHLASPRAGRRSIWGAIWRRWRSPIGQFPRGSARG